jgi:hypothetical protein
MVSSGMLRRVALVRTDVSEELTRATRLNLPEDTILQQRHLFIHTSTHFHMQGSSSCRY